MKKWIAGFLCFFFFTSNIFAQVPGSVPIPPRLLPLTPSFHEVEIPADLGSAIQRTGGGEPLIIHIQDAHAHYEAQIHIKKILEYLTRKHSIRLIGLEGASGPLRPELFRLFPDPKVNASVVDTLVREGELTGAEFFAIQEPPASNIEFLGLEDEALYRKDLKTFQSVLREWESRKPFFQAQRKEIARLKGRHFSRDLAKFDAEKQAFDEGRMDFYRYGRTLQKTAARLLNLDLKDPREQRELPNLVRVAMLSEMGSRLEKNRARIQEEIETLLGILKKVLPREDVEARFLLGGLNELKEARWNVDILPRYFFESLIGASRRHKIDLDRFPAFKEYARQLMLQSEINAPDLFKEIAALEKKIYGALIRSPEERELVTRSEHLKLLEKFLRLEVSKEEYDRVCRNGIDTASQKAEQFYKLAEKRESAMIDRLLKRAREKKLKHVVLISGGFHTEGIEKLLAEKNIAHVTLSPKISRKEETSYHHVIMNEKTWVEENLVGASGARPALGDRRSPLQENKITAALAAVDRYLNAADPHRPEKLTLGALIRGITPFVQSLIDQNPALRKNSSELVRELNAYFERLAKTHPWIRDDGVRLILAFGENGNHELLLIPSNELPEIRQTLSRYDFSPVGSPRVSASSLGISLAETFSRESELRREQEDEQQVQEEKLLRIHQEFRERAARGEFRLIGQESESDISALAGLADQWAREDDHVIFVGDAVDASGPLLLQGLTHRNDWNTQARMGQRPQVYFVDGYDPGTLKSLQEKIRSAQPQKVRIVVAGTLTALAESLVSDLRREFPAIKVEDSNLERFSSDTVGLLAAGLVLNSGLIREIYEGARQSYESWQSLNPDGIRRYPPYQFAATEVRMAKTGQNVSVFMMFSMALRNFSVYLAQLFNRSVGTADMPLWFSGENLVYLHSTQQAHKHAVDFPHNEEIRQRAKRGFISLVLLNPNRLQDVAVSGPAQPMLRGFGFRFIARITRAAYRLSMRLARRPIMELDFDVHNASDLGRLLHFAQISAAMTGKLAGDDASRDATRTFDEGVTSRLETATGVSLPEGGLERGQNIFSASEKDGGVQLGGLIGEALERENAQGANSLLHRVLGILNRVGKKLESKVIKPYRSGTELDHLNPQRIEEEMEASQGMAELFRGKRTIYAVSVGGSTTGPIMADILRLEGGPEIVELQSYDADLMARIQQDIEFAEDPENIGVVIISKSGVTTEVDVNGWTLVDTLGRALARKTGDENAVKNQVLIITDPQVGTLRKKVMEEGWRMLAHPVLIGGRWTMFSSVGLFYYFLKGGSREDLEKAVRFLKGDRGWDQELADELKAVGGYKDLLDPRKEVSFSDRKKAISEVIKLLSKIPGVWEGILDYMVNTLKELDRDTEVALSLDRSFENFISHKSPFGPQLRAESKSKPGIRFYSAALWGWNAIRNAWNRLLNNRRVYVALYGVTSPAESGMVPSAASRFQEGTWATLVTELDRNRTPYLALRTGPMNVSNLLQLMQYQYRRLAVDMALYEPMDHKSEGQPGVEETKKIVEAVLTSVARDIRDLPENKQEAARKNGIPIREIPADQIESMNEIPMDLHKSLGMELDLARLIEQLIQGSEDHPGGLLMRETLDQIRDNPTHRIPQLMQDLLLRNFLGLPDVRAIYLDGRRPTVHGRRWIIRANSLENASNVVHGTANGTNIGIYEYEEGTLVLQASIQVLWGSSARVTVSNGRKTQDFKLKGDGVRIVEIDRPGEDNAVVMSQKGTYLAVGGVSNKRPDAFQRFERQVMRPSLNTAIRFSDAVSADTSLMMNKQGLMTHWMTRAEAYELAQIMETASGSVMFMTEEGLQHASDLKIREEDFLDTEQIYVYAGNPDSVKQIQVFLDYLYIDRPAGAGQAAPQPVVFDILSAFREIPGNAPAALKAQAIMWTLRLEEGLKALPPVKGLKGDIQSVVTRAFGEAQETLRVLNLQETLSGLKEQYLALPFEARKQRGDEFILLGHEDAGMVYDARVIPGEELKLVYRLHERFQRTPVWELLSRVKAICDRDGYVSVSGTINRSQTHLRESYRQNALTRRRPQADALQETPFGETLAVYLDQSVGVPEEVRQTLGLSSRALPQNARDVFNRVLDVYLHDQEIGDPKTDTYVTRLREALSDESEIFYERDGKTYIRSLHWIRQNIEERKSGASVNQTGDVSSRLDHIYNHVLIYFTRPLVDTIISEEEEDPVRGYQETGPDRPRLLAFIDPIDGSSQIKEAGTFGMIFTLGVLLPGQRLSEFDPRKQILASFDMQFGWPRTLVNVVNRARLDDARKAEMIQFELTLNEGQTGEAFRKQSRYPSLERMEENIQWHGLLPVPDPGKGLGVAMGGSFIDSRADDGHREVIGYLMDHFGYSLAYTGALINDIRKLLAQPPARTMGSLHTYGPTGKHEHGRFRLAFELYHYALMYEVLGGEVIDGIQPMMDHRLTDEKPSEITMPFYAANRWMTKLIMAWRGHVRSNLQGKNPSEQTMLGEFQTFIHRYEDLSGKLVQDLGTYSRSAGGNIVPRNDNEIRQALLGRDGDISRFIFETRPVEQIYQELFPASSAASLGGFKNGRSSKVVASPLGILPFAESSIFDALKGLPDTHPILFFMMAAVGFTGFILGYILLMEFIGGLIYQIRVRTLFKFKSREQRNLVFQKIDLLENAFERTRFARGRTMYAVSLQDRFFRDIASRAKTPDQLIQLLDLGQWLLSEDIDPYRFFEEVFPRLIRVAVSDDKFDFLIASLKGLIEISKKERSVSFYFHLASILQTLTDVFKIPEDLEMALVFLKDQANRLEARPPFSDYSSLSEKKIRTVLEAFASREEFEGVVRHLVDETLRAQKQNVNLDFILTDPVISAIGKIYKKKEEEFNRLVTLLSDYALGMKFNDVRSLEALGTGIASILTVSRTQDEIISGVKFYISQIEKLKEAGIDTHFILTTEIATFTEGPNTLDAFNRKLELYVRLAMDLTNKGMSPQNLSSGIIPKIDMTGETADQLFVAYQNLAERLHQQGIRYDIVFFFGIPGLTYRHSFPSMEIFLYNVSLLERLVFKPGLPKSFDWRNTDWSALLREIHSIIERGKDFEVDVLPEETREEIGQWGEPETVVVRPEIIMVRALAASLGVPELGPTHPKLEEDYMRQVEAATPGHVKTNRFLPLEGEPLKWKLPSGRFKIVLKREHLHPYREKKGGLKGFFHNIAGAIARKIVALQWLPRFILNRARKIANPQGLGLWDWLEYCEKEAPVATAGFRLTQNIRYPWDTRNRISLVGVFFATLAKSIVALEKYPDADLVKLAGGEVRYNTPLYVELIARVQAALGIRTLLPKDRKTIPIWMVSFLTFMYDLVGAEHVTSSHANSSFMATKDINNQGSQYLPEESLRFVAKIREIFEIAEREGQYEFEVAANDDPRVDEKIMAEIENGVNLYVEYLRKGAATEVNLERIRNAKNEIIVDNVGGSMHGTMPEIFDRLNIRHKFNWFHREEDSFFHGIGKDKGKDGEVVDYTQDVTIIKRDRKTGEVTSIPVMERLGYDTLLKDKPIGTTILMVDPDGDRLVTAQVESVERAAFLKEIGVDYLELDEKRIVALYTPNQSFLLTMTYHAESLKQAGLWENHPRFLIMTTASSTAWREWAEKNGVQVLNVPVGFKEIAAMMKKVEAQMKAHPDRPVIVRDVFGREVNLGVQPRMLFAGEESGGMIIGPEELIVSKGGRLAVAMREKSAGEAMIIQAAMAANLESQGRFISDYLKEVFEQNDIKGRFDVREDVVYYNQNNPDPVALKKDKAEGEGRRTQNYLFYLSMALAYRDKRITLEQIKMILNQTFESQNLHFFDLEEVYFVGDGVFFKFPDKVLEIRPSGTDAKSKSYGMGNDKKEIAHFAAEIGNYDGTITPMHQRYVPTQYVAQGMEIQWKVYQEYYKYGLPEDDYQPPQAIAASLGQGFLPEETVLIEQMGLSPIDRGYLEGLLRKYRSPEKRLKIRVGDDGNFIPSSMLTAEERARDFGRVEYQEILRELDRDEAQLENTKGVVVTLHPMDGGIGSSLKRAEYLRKTLGRTGDVKLGAKATDLKFDVELNGKKVSVSIAEAKLLRAIRETEIYGDVIYQPLVSDESITSYERLYDSIYLPDRIDDRIPFKKKRTYRQAAVDLGVSLADFLIQKVLPSIDPKHPLHPGGILSDERKAPGGHGQWGVHLLMNTYHENIPEDGKTHISVFCNGDNINSSSNRKLMSWFARSGIPVLIVSTEATPIDKKGGKLGLEFLSDGTRRPQIQEIAQAKKVKQTELFQKVGLPGGPGETGEQDFNTNLILINRSILSPFLKELGQLIEEDELNRIMSPDLIHNLKTNPDGKEFIQLEGAISSVFLNLNAYLIATQDERIRVLMQKYGFDRLLCFVFLRKSDRTRFFTPVKAPTDFWLQNYSDYYVFDTKRWSLWDSEKDLVPPGFDLSDPYYEEVQNLIDSLGRASTRRLRFLTIKGVASLKDAVLVGEVSIENKSGKPVDLNDPKYKLPRTADGKLYLINIEIVIDEKGSMTVAEAASLGESQRLLAQAQERAERIIVPARRDVIGDASSPIRLIHYPDLDLVMNSITAKVRGAAFKFKYYLLFMPEFSVHGAAAVSTSALPSFQELDIRILLELLMNIGMRSSGFVIPMSSEIVRRKIAEIKSRNTRVPVLGTRLIGEGGGFQPVELVTGDGIFQGINEIIEVPYDQIVAMARLLTDLFEEHPFDYPAQGGLSLPLNFGVAPLEQLAGFIGSIASVPRRIGGIVVPVLTTPGHSLAEKIEIDSRQISTETARESLIRFGGSGSDSIRRGDSIKRTPVLSQSLGTSPANKLIRPVPGTKKKNPERIERGLDGGRPADHRGRDIVRDVEKILLTQGRSLGEVTVAVNWAGRVIGPNEHGSVQDYFLSALGIREAQAASTGQGEFAILATFAKHLSVKALKREMKENPLALAVIVTENIPDLEDFEFRLREKLGGDVFRRVIVIGASRNIAGEVLKGHLSSKEFLTFARKFSPRLTDTQIRQHTTLFASEKVLEVFRDVSLQVRLVAADKKGEIAELIHEGRFTQEEFNLYGNTTGFELARKGGFDQLAPDRKEGLMRPDASINWVYFNMTLLAEKILQMSREMAGAQALGRAA